jgi:hypothetical protein
MSDDLQHVPEELEIPTGPDSRLLVRAYENATGRRLVSIAPQYQDRSHEWRLSHSGLLLAPQIARELAPALLAMAATIDGAPEDPMPTEEDRCASRMP